MDYSFHIYNKMAADGAAMALEKLLKADFIRMHRANKQGKITDFSPLDEDEELASNAPPVVVCIGSDLSIGDSLGPITGSLLRYKTQGVPFYLYGTLAAPVTAKEISYMRTFLKETHPSSQVIAVDAAVGNKGDIGLIRVSDTPLRPGAGADKQLGEIGDLTVMGIVAEKSLQNYGFLNTTRLNLVYTMSELISEALSSLLWERCSRPKCKGKLAENS